MAAAQRVADVAQQAAVVVVMQAVDKAKAHAAQRTHREAQRLTVAHGRLTRSKMDLTKVLRKSVMHRPHPKAAVRTATLLTHASANTCSATACTCSPAH